MKPFLILCVGVLLAAPVAGIHAAGLEPQRDQAGAIGDVQLPYADMVRAYQNGRLDEGRRLARAHLVRTSGLLARARNDRDRESVVRRLLGIVHSMLAAENTFAPAARFGGDLSLGRYVRDTLVQTRTVSAALVQVPPAVQRYIRSESATTGRLWLRAAAAQLPRTELVAFYQVFRDELRESGLATVDSALAEPVPIAGAPEPVAASLADTDSILAVVRDYFAGLASGDSVRLASATGLGEPRLSALLAERDADYRHDGLRAVTNVTVPSQPDLTLRAMPAAGASMYSFTVRGVVMDVVLLDGTKSRRTISKYFRARKNDTGRWTLVIPG